MVCRSFQVAIRNNAAFSLVGKTGSQKEAMQMLLSLNVDVMLLDLELDEGDGMHLLEEMRAKLERIPEIITVTNTSSESVLSCVRELGSDFVYQKHNGAYSPALIAIPFSYHSPDAYVDTNIKGTLNVLQAARMLETERVLITSTSEVYGTAQYVPIDEKHPYQGQSPYSATKIGADRLAESFYRSFNLPVSIVRPFNTFGPRQSARAVIPTIISQLLAGKEEIKLGSLTPTRDFNYVKDTAAGFIAIAESDQTIGQEINIATQQEISIGELAQEIIDQINPKAKIVCDEQRLRPEKSEVNRLLGSNAKIKELTDWQQKYTFAQGIAETIAWMRDHMDSYKADIYNV